MKSNKELLEELQSMGPEAQKVAMAGLPCPRFDVPNGGGGSWPPPKQEPKLPPQGASGGSGPAAPTKLNRKQRRAAAKKAINKAKNNVKAPEPKVHYICDPTKNIACKKTSCHINGGPCKCTTYIEYAKQPIEKVQMILPVSGKERRDLMKQYSEELKKQ